MFDRFTDRARKVMALARKEAQRFNHDPTRTRKLLMHKREILRLMGKVQEKGLTLVPLRLYFKDGYAKVELALARGKKLYDKRSATRSMRPRAWCKRESVGLQ